MTLSSARYQTGRIVTRNSYRTGTSFRSHVSVKKESKVHSFLVIKENGRESSRTSSRNNFPAASTQF